jgi:hypothetical protein
MWQIDNPTPFGALGDWVRDREGAEVWIVAVRCAFAIRSDGHTEVEENQDPPVLAPVFYGAPGVSSLLYDSDFYLSKPTTDILLHGHAYAPGNDPVTRVDVGMRVGQLTKVLRVTGDRVYRNNGLRLATSEPRPFIKMPITYERAYGGGEAGAPADPGRPRFHPSNPVGVGFMPMVGGRAPNIEYAAGDIRQPAGFGPIPSHWQPRTRFAGTYDSAWQKERLPLYPLDLNDRFFLSAPRDQQPPQYLRGGEAVQFANLSPGGRIAFVLPKLAFRFETEIRGKRPVAHRGALHTVIFEPDRPRVIMVWQTALRAHSDATRLMRTSVALLEVMNPPPGAIPIGLGDAFDDLREQDE